ncbi:MAG TPA: TIGR03557 family F420-dependent LLM class oxidoreductase [Nocardioidaceae bacterium]|nr:TIGR03557 family F420-dependent LLM class oxidoreductase [Nocardioidaceae bacterium]
MSVTRARRQGADGDGTAPIEASATPTHETRRDRVVPTHDTFRIHPDDRAVAAPSLVNYAASAEAAGFDFEVMSDHYFPWLDEQGHAGYAWSMLGAISQVTERVELMTYVTCPILRYHPAVVAQKAATVQILTEGRFTLGLGRGRTSTSTSSARAGPASTFATRCWRRRSRSSPRSSTGYVTYGGKHFRVDSAKLWDLPERRVPIGIAVSGKQSISKFAPLADALVAVEPDAGLVRDWDQASGSGSPGGGNRKIGQIPVCWNPSNDEAVARAHEQFRWFGGGWKVNAELPGTAAFAGATQFIRPEDVAQSIPCGPEVGPIVEAVSAYWEAGFTDVALVQIGDQGQDDFLKFAESELLPALREASPDQR